jgi:hypothetical protein
VSGRGVVIVDLDDTCIADRSASLAAIGELAESLGVELEPERLLRQARELWRDGPFRQYCLRIGLSSWEADGFEKWLSEYQLAVWREALGEQVEGDGQGLARAAAITYRQTRVKYTRALPGVFKS